MIDRTRTPDLAPRRMILIVLLITFAVWMGALAWMHTRLGS